MQKIRSLILMVCALTVLTGCVAYKKSNVLIFNEKERVQVKFESAKAANMFHKKMAEKSHEGFEEKEEGLLVGIAYGEKVKFYSTYFYNEQVRLTDINGDGVITEEEVKNYCEFNPKPNKDD